MYHHTETEHQNYRVHCKCYGVREVQDIENTVISKVDNQGVYRIVTGLAETYKDIVDDDTPGVCDIKRNEPYDDSENLASIFKSLCNAKERRPCGNRDRPKNHACGGDKVIIELLKFLVSVFAVRADDLGKGGERNEQPPPDKIIRIPIVTLFGDHINHFANHNGIDKVVDKLLESGKHTSSEPIAEHYSIRPSEPTKADVSLLIQQQNTRGGEQYVCNNV